MAPVNSTVQNLTTHGLQMSASFFQPLKVLSMISSGADIYRNLTSLLNQLSMNYSLVS